MMRKIQCLLASLGMVSTWAIGADLEARGSTYCARSFFTDALRDQCPGRKIETATADTQRIILYTEWSQLEDRLYQKEVQVFDPFDALVGTWYYEFTPVEGAFNTWDWWDLREHHDQPGVWRFVVHVDGEPAFENQILVEARRPIRPRMCGTGKLRELEYLRSGMPGIQAPPRLRIDNADPPDRRDDPARHTLSHPEQSRMRPDSAGTGDR